MTIEYHIDPERRLVHAVGHGTVTGEEVFAYQREAWSRPEVAGFDELFDMRAVERVVPSSTNRMQELAFLSAEMEGGAPPSKFAIVTVNDLAFGMGRMYEAYRDMESRSTKVVRVFRTMEAARAWLDSDPEPPVNY